jgi:hypothetical protein
MFEPLSIGDAKPIAVLKRFFLLVFIGLLGIGAVSSYRAYVQVRSLHIIAEKQLRSGSAIDVSVISSGRTPVDVKVELIQGSTIETLFALHVRGNELGFFDPRAKHATQTGYLTNELLKPFTSAPAIIRATAVGRPQWMRLPPPTVREFTVELRTD